MSASEPIYEGDVVTKTTSCSVADTVERLSELLDEKGLKRSGSTCGRLRS